jgi:hypothetical protein
MARIIVSGVWTGIGDDASYGSHFRGLGSAEITWGEPVNTRTSSYAFEGTSTVARVDGPAFVLGTFTHHNFPIYIPFDRFWADLQVTVTLEDGTKRDFPVRFRHYESPNRGPEAAWADVVDLPTVRVEKAVAIDGIECDMLISGFYWHGTEQPSPRFHSPENESNQADLHVRFTPYTGPR